ncbi:MAG: hypothetical protein ACKVE4_00305 [Dissulfuribacterales bacterium]
MLYFDDLLKKDDFSKAVNELADDFMKEHGLAKVHQVGLVVPDVEKTAKKLEDQGFGPFFIASGSAPGFFSQRCRLMGGQSDKSRSAGVGTGAAQDLAVNNGFCLYGAIGKKRPDHGIYQLAHIRFQLQPAPRAIKNCGQD